MRSTTHIAAGTVGGLLLAKQIGVPLPEATLITACSIAGSLFPDIDICTSKIGSITKPASIPIHILFGHRTITHSIMTYVILGILMFHTIAPEYTIFITAVLLGITTHLFLDILNPRGIPICWPINIKLKLGVCRSGGFIDRLLGKALSLIALYLLISYCLQWNLSR